MERTRSSRKVPFGERRRHRLLAARSSRPLRLMRRSATHRKQKLADARVLLTSTRLSVGTPPRVLAACGSTRDAKVEVGLLTGVAATHRQGSMWHAEVTAHDKRPKSPRASGNSWVWCRDGDGGNRTHVRGRAETASTSVASPLFSSRASLTGRVARNQPLHLVPPPPEAHVGSKPVSDAGHLPHGPRGGRQLTG